MAYIDSLSLNREGHTLQVQLSFLDKTLKKVLLLSQIIYGKWNNRAINLEAGCL